MKMTMVLAGQNSCCCVYTNTNIMTTKLYMQQVPNLAEWADFDKNAYFLALELYGCSFQAPHCLTQT